MGKLHEAIRNGLTKSAMKLLAGGTADVNAQDAAGKTPVTLTVALGDGEMAEQLIAHGADVHAPDRRQRQPLLLAASGHAPVVEVRAAAW